MGVITGYSDDTSTTDSDKFLTLASDNTTKLTPASNVNKYLSSGWFLSGDAWSYSSWNSTTNTGVINASSGANTKYSAGMWFRFSQPTLGVKYFRVLSSTSTTVTIKAYDGSVLSNEAITSPVFSPDRAPFGALQAGTIESTDINFGGSGAGVWWEEIGRTTLSGSASTLSVASFASRKYLQIKAVLLATGGTTGSNFTFNSDTTSNYSFRSSTSGAAETTGSSTSIGMGQGLITDPLYVIMDIVNITTQEKPLYFRITRAGAAGSANIGVRVEGAAKWANTSSQITSINFPNSGTGSYAAGSEIIVLGHN